jgi:UDP-glucose 6-dehydrogenase
VLKPPLPPSAAAGAARVMAMGLTFKPGTSDVRDLPALTICADLARASVQVTSYNSGSLPSTTSKCAGRQSSPSMTHIWRPSTPTPPSGRSCGS